MCRTVHVGASGLQVAMLAGQGYRNSTIRSHKAKYVGSGDNTVFVMWGRQLGLIPEKQGTDAMKYGRDQEAIALAHYVRSTQQEVQPNGYFIKELEENFTLGYSPDGLVKSSHRNGYTKGLVEIKAPFRADKQATPLNSEVCVFYTIFYICLLAMFLSFYIIYSVYLLLFI